MKKAVWLFGALVVVSLLSGAVVGFLSREPPLQPAPPPLESSRTRVVASRSEPRHAALAVTVRGVADSIPLYALDFDNPRYVLTGYAQPQGVLVKVHATMTNVSDSVLSLDESADFALVDEDGVSYGVSTPATVRPRWTRFRRTPIAEMRLRPWEPYEALLYFDLPERTASGELGLRFRDDPAASFKVHPRD